MIKIKNVNIAKKRSLDLGDRCVETGIYKYSQPGSVTIKTQGLVGDEICDDRHHGGPDQAVYVYRSEDYQWWSEQRKEAIAAGTFGENLTIEGIATPGLFVGDRLCFDKLVLEITAPRIPCAVFARRMGSAGFAKAFVNANRPGFYCRVITEGQLCEGDEGRVEKVGFPSISTIEFYQDMIQNVSLEKMQHYLQLPIDMRTRRKFEQKLAK